MNATTSKMIQIHISLESTLASVKLGEVAVTKAWKETKNQNRMCRGVVIPMECVKAPEVPESFKALVEACLQQSAETVLQRFVENNREEGQSECFEIPAELFARTALVEGFLNKDSQWLSKVELEALWMQSATWKRIAGRNEFISNKLYQQQANAFKDTILKLSGKAAKLPVERCEAILSKLEDSDLETPVGSFIVKRLQSFMQDSSAGFSIDML